MGFKFRLLLIGLGSIVGLTLVLLISAAWQNRTFVGYAETELLRSARYDLQHLAVGGYNTVKCQDESLRDNIGHNIIVADHTIKTLGGINLSGSHSWKATNQFSKVTTDFSIPVMSIGGKALVANSDPQVPTPVVDDITRLVGGMCTVFQRVNKQGDMLRIATNVISKTGKRAVGTYIPAVNPDGKPNPVVASLLSGKTYEGMAYVVDSWCVTAYKPLLDSSGAVTGAIFVGIRQENVPSLRHAIVSTKIDKSGYIWVVSGKGETNGQYVISKNSAHDGVYLLDRADPSGKYPVKEMIDKGKSQPGSPFYYEYMWKDSPESQPRKKMVTAVYYEPWGWLIGASAYQDEFLAPVANVRASGRKMLWLLLFTSLVAMAIAAYGYNVFASKTAERLVMLNSVAKAMATGDVDLASKLLDHSDDQAA